MTTINIHITELKPRTEREMKDAAWKINNWGLCTKTSKIVAEEIDGEYVIYDGHYRFSSWMKMPVNYIDIIVIENETWGELEKLGIVE